HREAAAPVFDRFENPALIYGWVDGMRHQPHGLNAVADATQATPKNVLFVVTALPLAGGDAKNLRNGAQSQRGRGGYARQSMEQVEQNGFRSRQWFFGTNHPASVTRLAFKCGSSPTGEGLRFSSGRVSVERFF